MQIVFIILRVIIESLLKCNLFYRRKNVTVGSNFALELLL